MIIVEDSIVVGIIDGTNTVWSSSEEVTDYTVKGNVVAFYSNGLWSPIVKIAINGEVTKTAEIGKKDWKLLKKFLEKLPDGIQATSIYNNIVLAPFIEVTNSLKRARLFSKRAHGLGVESPKWIPAKKFKAIFTRDAEIASATKRGPFEVIEIGGNNLFGRIENRYFEWYMGLPVKMDAIVEPFRKPWKDLVKKGIILVPIVRNDRGEVGIDLGKDKFYAIVDGEFFE